MKSRILSLILLALLWLTPSQIEAKVYTVETVPNVQVADRTRFVTDPDNLLGESATRHIDSMLAQVRDSNTVETAVVVLPSIGNSDIDLFATDLFTHWGIGRSNDNGLLILTVIDQRRVVFRTGYGIEGVLPDAICKRIIDSYIIPAFRQGDYGGGLEAAVTQVVRIITTPEASAELTAGSDSTGGSFNLLNILYFYLACSFIISLLLMLYLNGVIRKHKDSPYDGYKQLRGMLSLLQILAIFFPLWGVANLSRCRKKMQAFRDTPRTCENCGALMHKLDEHEDNAFLTPQEDMEEKIGSVDYDVWMCDQCRNIDVLRFEALYTQYTECPQCHAMAYSLARDHIVRPASSVSAGEGEKIYVCSYCKMRKVIPYVIPMIVVASHNNRGGGSIGGGFGGGMTGGGGAGGSW